MKVSLIDWIQTSHPLPVVTWRSNSAEDGQVAETWLNQPKESTRFETSINSTDSFRTSYQDVLPDRKAYIYCRKGCTGPAVVGGALDPDMRDDVKNVTLDCF